MSTILRELVNLIGFDVDEAQWASVEKKMDKLTNGMDNIGRKASTFLTLPIMGAAGYAVKAFSESKEAIAQIEASILNTGNAAGKSSEELAKNALALQEQTIMGDDEILRQVTAQLLTFTNIAGKEFDRVQEAVLDVSAKLDPSMKNVQSIAIQMGKAFNDPKGALSALTRSGIQFTEQQKKMIETLVDSGQLQKAQLIMLDEIERQYKGSAKAAADSSTGVKQMWNELGNLAEVFGEMLYPYVKKVTDKIREFAKMLQTDLSPQMKWIIMGIGGLLAVVGPLLLAFSFLINTGFQTVNVFMKISKAVAIAQGSTALLAGEFILIALAIVAAVVLIALLVEEINAYMKGSESFIGRFLEPWATLKPKLKALFEPILNSFKVFISGIMDIMGGLVKFIGGAFTGDVDKAIQGINQIIDGVHSIVIDARISENVFTLLQKVWSKIAYMIDNMVQAIWQYIQDWFGRVFDWIDKRTSGIFSKLGKLANWFTDPVKGQDVGLPFRKLGEWFSTPEYTEKDLAFAGAFKSQPETWIKNKNVPVNALQNFTKNPIPSSKQLDIKANVNVYVPNGTPQFMMDAAKESARQGAEKVFSEKLNDLFANIREVE